jgi:hypothetical protein
MPLSTLLSAVLTRYGLVGGLGVLARRGGRDGRDRLSSELEASAAPGRTGETPALARLGDQAQPEGARPVADAPAGAPRPPVLDVPVCRLLARWSVEDGRLHRRWRLADVPPGQESARLSWAALGLAAGGAGDLVRAALVSAAPGGASGGASTAPRQAGPSQRRRRRWSPA